MSYTLNLIPNGSLQLWDAGPVPREMDAQVTNTTLIRLERRRAEEAFFQTQNWADIRGRYDRFTYEGEDSLRANIVAAAAIDAFRLFPEGALVALTGASTRQVLVQHLHRYSFSLGARCSADGNLLRIRVVLRSAGDAILAYLNVNEQWQVAATQIDLGMRTTWARYGVVTPDVPQQVGGTAVENMVWQVSNGTAGAQFIDLDDLVMVDLTAGFSSP